MTKEQFIGNFENWDNYKPLLWLALEATDGDVIEMGMGIGSTKVLHEYCESKLRMLYSYDNAAQYFNENKKFESQLHKVTLVENWDIVNEQHKNPDVVFIDHAPGERRHIDLELFANKAKIIVIHDSEPEATGYMLDKVWHLFKYRKDFETKAAWATMVSNQIDITVL